MAADNQSDSAAPETEGTSDSGSMLTIGRSSSCDLTIDHPRISRIHCSLTPVPEGWLLRDHTSRNGTFVMGEKITQCFVTAPMKFVVGQVEVELTEDGKIHDLAARAKRLAEERRAPKLKKKRTPKRRKKKEEQKKTAAPAAAGGGVKEPRSLSPALSMTAPAITLMVAIGIAMVFVFTKRPGATGPRTAKWNESSGPETIWRSDHGRTEWAEEEYLDVFPILQDRLAKAKPAPRVATGSDEETRVVASSVKPEFVLKLPPRESRRHAGTSVQTKTIPIQPPHHESELNILLLEASDLLRRYHVRDESVALFPNLLKEIAEYDSPRAAEVMVELHHRDMQLLDKLEKRMKRLRVPTKSFQSGIQKTRTKELAHYLAELLARQRKHLLEMEEIVFWGMAELESGYARSRLLRVAFENPDSRRNVRVAQITARWDDINVVPILIHALRTPDSSLRSAIRDSLRVLTGEHFHNRTSWEKWWNEKSQEETKEVADDR